MAKKKETARDKMMSAWPDGPICYYKCDPTTATILAPICRYIFCDYGCSASFKVNRTDLHTTIFPNTAAWEFVTGNHQHCAWCGCIIWQHFEPEEKAPPPPTKE